MIDPYSKRIISNSEFPSSIKDAKVIIDLLSETYIDERIKNIFDINLKNNKNINKVALLSLSSSILDDSSKNAFLIGESEDILIENTDDNNIDDISRIVRLTDIAFYYHISNFDANAGIIAKKILEAQKESTNISPIQKKYLQTFSFFLLGKFNKIEQYNIGFNDITTYDKIFAFLMSCLYDLSIFYKSGSPYNIKTWIQQASAT